MSTRISSPIPFISPEPIEPQVFDDPAKAVDALTALYGRNTGFLKSAFGELAKGGSVEGRYRAFYPQVSIETTSFGLTDSRLSYGHVTSPGIYQTTITRPKLFRHYLKEQLSLLMRNHNVPVRISESTTPIPLHFAFGEGAHVEASASTALADVPLRDLFETPTVAGLAALLERETGLRPALSIPAIEPLGRQQRNSLQRGQPVEQRLRGEDELPQILRQRHNVSTARGSSGDQQGAHPLFGRHNLQQRRRDGELQFLPLGIEQARMVGEAVLKPNAA